VPFNAASAKRKPGTPTGCSEQFGDIDGARARPPEDCGGVHAFAEIVAGRMDADTRRWLPRGYNLARFDPAAVRFEDPAHRLAFSWYGDADAGDTPHG
jgi:hypothetical protein